MVQRCAAVSVHDPRLIILERRLVCLDGYRYRPNISRGSQLRFFVRCDIFVAFHVCHLARCCVGPAWVVNGFVRVVTFRVKPAVLNHLKKEERASRTRAPAHVTHVTRQHTSHSHTLHRANQPRASAHAHATPCEPTKGVSTRTCVNAAQTSTYILVRVVHDATPTALVSARAHYCAHYCAQLCQVEQISQYFTVFVCKKTPGN